MDFAPSSARPGANLLELPALPPADLPADSDRDLMERFRAGDRDAFTALYRAHHAAVFRFAFHMTGDPIKAGDITQDVFVWLIHHPGAFDAGRGDLPAFLGGVARQFLRREQRRERRWQPLPRLDTRATRDSGDTALDLARAIDTAALRRAIALLPANYREAVVLCDLQGQSYDEAAQALGCAVGTVRSRLHRARRLLVRKLQPPQPTRRYPQ